MGKRGGISPGTRAGSSTVFSLLLVATLSALGARAFVAPTPSFQASPSSRTGASASASSTSALSSSAASASSPAVEAATSSAPLLSELAEEDAQALLSKLRGVASDIDGTLTGSDRRIPPGVLQAITDVLDSGVFFFPATGKSRAAFRGSLEGHPLDARIKAGVFLNGMISYGPDGKVVHERLLPLPIVRKVVAFCMEQNLSLIAFHGDDIVCSERDKETDRIMLYYENTPIEVGPLDAFYKAGAEVSIGSSGWGLSFGDDFDREAVHKLIVLAPEEKIKAVRGGVEETVGEEASLTQALGDMLEVLPRGGSKAQGVKAVLKAAGLTRDEVMAMGDAENDLEMLELAGVALAMGNALPSVKEIAQVIGPPNTEEGAGFALSLLMRCREQ